MLMADVNGVQHNTARSITARGKETGMLHTCTLNLFVSTGRRKDSANFTMFTFINKTLIKYITIMLLVLSG